MLSAGTAYTQTNNRRQKGPHFLSPIVRSSEINKMKIMNVPVYQREIHLLFNIVHCSRQELVKPTGYRFTNIQIQVKLTEQQRLKEEPQLLERFP